MKFGIIGTSIWQQNHPLLERLTIDRDEKPAVLQKLKSRMGLDELIYLSTCNRVEFIYAVSDPISETKLLHRLIDFFFADKKNIDFFPNDFYHFRGKEAITHLFRTTSSLESLVMGENQIMGQMKKAHQEAMDEGLAGKTLNKLASEALAVARKIKSQTELGAGSLSMASLAANELSENLATRDNPVIALVGSGPMQEKMAKYISQSLKAQLLFVNRTLEKAEKLARQFNSRAVSLEDFRANPEKVDAIVSATAAVEPIFDSDFLNMLADKNSQVICVDLAVPRDFSLDFVGHEKIIMVDIPYLKSKGQGNLRQKFIEAGKANEIVREAVNKFLSQRVEVSLKPIFRDSYQESIELAQQALNDLFSNRVKSLEKKEQDAVINLVTKLIGQSSFGPIRRLSSQLISEKSEISLDNISAVNGKVI